MEGSAENPIDLETPEEVKKWADREKKTRKDRARKKKCCSQFICTHVDPDVKAEESEESEEGEACKLFPFPFIRIQLLFVTVMCI